jgi:hypothetical protein
LGNVSAAGIKEKSNKNLLARKKKAGQILFETLWCVMESPGSIIYVA